MKRSITILFALLSFFACRNDADSPVPGLEENKDWYILRAPENRKISTVYGNIRGTLYISKKKIDY